MHRTRVCRLLDDGLKKLKDFLVEASSLQDHLRSIQVAMQATLEDTQPHSFVFPGPMLSNPSCSKRAFEDFERMFDDLEKLSDASGFIPEGNRAGASAAATQIASLLKPTIEAVMQRFESACKDAAHSAIQSAFTTELIDPAQSSSRSVISDSPPTSKLRRINRALSRLQSASKSVPRSRGADGETKLTPSMSTSASPVQHKSEVQHESKELLSLGNQCSEPLSHMPKTSTLLESGVAMPTANEGLDLEFGPPVGRTMNTQEMLWELADTYTKNGKGSPRPSCGSTSPRSLMPTNTFPSAITGGPLTPTKNSGPFCPSTPLRPRAPSTTKIEQSSPPVNRVISTDQKDRGSKDGNRMNAYRIASAADFGCV